MEGAINIERVGDICKIEIVGSSEACDKVIAFIANMSLEQPSMSDADKICQALDEVTRELRSVRDAIKYK